MEHHPTLRQSFSPPPHHWDSIFDELWHSRRMLQIWYHPITFLAVRYNTVVKYALRTEVLRRPGGPLDEERARMLNSIFGIPLIEDPTLPPNPGYAIDFALEG